MSAVPQIPPGDAPLPQGESRPSRLLVVDDDPAFRRLCSLALGSAGIPHVTVGSSKEALQALQNIGEEPFDLILLDMELPGMKGWELLKLLRDKGRDIPVVLVTVLESVAEKVRALDLCADDYVVKPFAFDELLSRLQAVLRRTQGRRTILVGDLSIDPLLRRVRCNGSPVELTPREFELLSILVNERNRVVTKGELLSLAWKLDTEPSTNFLEVHLSRLRRKLPPNGRVRLETVHGLGYRLVELAEGQPKQ
jgi:two-component system OmpR family response regulator